MNFRYLMVDIETKGQDMIRNDMLCFAAVIGNSITGKIEEEFIRYIKPSSPIEEVGEPLLERNGWEPMCVKQFWTKPSNKDVLNQMLTMIKMKGVISSVAMTDFYTWVNNRPESEFDQIVIMTDNPSFDIPFLNYYLAKTGLPSMNYIMGNKYKSVRDTNSFHMGIAKQLPSTGLYKSVQAAMKALDIPAKELADCPYKHDHNPLNDCKHMFYEAYLVARTLNQTF